MKTLNSCYLLLCCLIVFSCKENSSANSVEQTTDSLYVKIVNYKRLDTILTTTSRNDASIELQCESNLPRGTKIIITRRAGYETVTQQTFQLIDTITLNHSEFKTTISASMIYGYVLFMVDEKSTNKNILEDIKSQLLKKPIAKNHFFDCDALFCSYWNIYPPSDIQRYENSNAIGIDIDK
jgi:hypothetical protein